MRGESATMSGIQYLNTVVISGDEVCWNAVFGTLVGVSVFRVIPCQITQWLKRYPPRF